MNTQINLICLFWILLPSTAQAYIGPGLGLGSIGVILGVLASSVLILISILWYPLKRFLKWLRRGKIVDTKISNEKDL